MLIFQVPSRPADLNTVLVQVYNLGEEANTEQERKKFHPFRHNSQALQ